MSTPKRVLVVDDDQAFCESVAMFVGHLGHQPAMANSGAEALIKLSSDQFDVVLADLMMPGMCGEELAFEIKKRHPDLPVAVMTGQPGQRSEDVALVLRKPFSLMELRAVIPKLCGR
jgi:CheY-like chemotaxis protein